MSEGRARVGVSSCLLGEMVRYDGREKRIPWIADVLAREVELVSICPEVGAGMPVPRPPVQIVQSEGRGLRLLVVGEGADLTDSVQHFMRRELQGLKARPIDGYVFKARSPSCGLRDTPHFASAAGHARSIRLAAGVWASRLRQELPELPLVDESDLEDEAARERFLEQVREHWRARQR